MGITNPLTDDHESAKTIPVPNISPITPAFSRLRDIPSPAVASPLGMRVVSGNSRRRAGIMRSGTRAGVETTSSDTFQPHADGIRDHSETAQDAEHARELEDVEPQRGARPSGLYQNGGEPSHHGQGVGDPEEEAPGEKNRQRPRAHEETEPHHEDDGSGDERRGETPGDEGAHGHGSRHARESEGTGHQAQLPVGQPLGPADLGQKRTERADAEGVAEEQDEEQTGAVEPGEAARACHLNERSVHHG
jgi:hypothetical protein